MHIHQSRGDLVTLLESLTTVTGDIDGDSHVDVVDLLDMVYNFGT